MSNSVKMVCPNKSCINKSPVYRKFNALDLQRCKLCNTPLVNTAGVRVKQQDKIAKDQLGKYND